MRKEILLPGIAAGGGVAGLLLRRWELATAFEAETGLPISGAPATWSLIALTLLVAGALLLLCPRHAGAFPGGYDQAFCCSSPLYATGAIAGGFFLGAAGLVQLFHLPQVLRQAMITAEVVKVTLRVLLLSLPQIALAALCLASALCVVLTAKNNYRAEGKGKRSGKLLLPAYTCCLWLITAYQVRAGDPVVLDYLYELFAIISTLLALYFMSGFSFQRARPVLTCFFCLMGVYFSLVTLADAHALDRLLLYAFAIFYLLASAAALLSHAGKDAAAPRATEDQPEEDAP